MEATIQVARMTSYKTTNSTAGFSLIELVMIILLTAVMALITMTYFGDNFDASRFDQTKAKMELLRIAMLGQDDSQDQEGVRQNYGYLGDVGAMPTALIDLVSLPSGVATWYFNTFYALGAGWRGPYIAATAISNEKTFDVDGWGRNFIYTTGATTTLKSKGSDNADNGSGFAADLIMTIPQSARMATVHGLLEDNDQRASSKVVEMMYPVAGTLASVVTTTDANGFFKFEGVPFGLRGIRVQSSSGQKMRPIRVERSDIIVPSALINLFGKAEAVTYVASSLFKKNTDKDIQVALRSTYSDPVQLATATVTWTGGGSLDAIAVNGSIEYLSAITSGVSASLSSDHIIHAYSDTNSFEFRFSTAPTATTDMTAVLTWRHRTNTDTITVTL